MTQFRYQALDAKQQLITGQIEAETVSQAIAQLEANGLAVQSITSAAADLAAASADSPFQGELRPGGGGDQSALRVLMERVLAQGMSIVPALRAYAQELPDQRGRRQMLEVVRVLAGGNVDEAISSLQARPEYWIPLLCAAATPGEPGHVLREFLAESKRIAALRRYRSQAITYPLSIAGIAVGVFITLSYLVIPTFREIFADFGLSLPKLTLWVIGISDWVNSGKFLITAAVLIAILIAIFRGLPASVGEWLTDHAGLPWGRSMAVARFSRFLADLLEAGLGIPAALRIASFASNRPRLQRAASRFADAVHSDKDDPQPDRRYLTTTVEYALRSEMSPASRVRLLREVSDCHAERRSALLSWRHGFAAPIAVAVIGVFVGVMVIALFMPMVNLINNLSGSK
ncbi:MAG: type II secretion system F family protein [Pirellulales bacterium]